jgi:hypothetical protein
MRYVLTVDGVPVGFVTLATGRRVAAYLVPFSGFIETGLAAAAFRRGLALTLTHGPTARPSPRQRRLVREVREERRRWEERLGLLDPYGAMVPAGSIGVVWCPERRPFVLVDFTLLPVRLGATVAPVPAEAGGMVSPAA